MWSHRDGWVSLIGSSGRSRTRAGSPVHTQETAMRDGMTPKVLELVVFQLIEGTTHDAFLATEAPMAAWIRQQPGFVSYDLLLADDTQAWVFAGWWDSMTEAKAAAAAAESAEGTAPMFALIDFEARSYLYLHAGPAVPATATETAAPT